MASEVFSLVYDGDAIQDGEMSAAALGPALIALGELFEIANSLLNGSETTVATNVKAEFKEGSFEVFFHIHQMFSDPSAILMPGVFVVGANPLINQVMGKALDKAKDKLGEVAVEGFFKLLETMRGRKPERIERDDSRNVSVVIIGSNNRITVTPETARLYENPRARSLASRVGSPLKQEGITKLRVRRDNEEIVELEQRDFPEVEDVEMLVEATSMGDQVPQRLIVQILKPAFVEGKWSVSDGNKRFQVDMEDLDFKSRVHEREVGFYEGDLYRVEMVTTQHMKKGKLSTDRKITRVIEPVNEAVQESLELPSSPTTGEGRRFRDNE